MSAKVTADVKNDETIFALTCPSHMAFLKYLQSKLI